MMEKKFESKMEDANVMFDEAWKLLGEKGLTFGERLKVRNAIAKWADSFPRNVQKKTYKSNYVSTHAKISNIGFETAQECVLFNSLYELSPETDKSKLIEVLKVVNTLLGVNSDYKL